MMLGCIVNKLLLFLGRVCARYLLSAGHRGDALTPRL